MVGPPRSQTRRNLFVRHIPPATLHQALITSRRRRVVEHGDEDTGWWRELLRLLRLHFEEKMNNNTVNG